MGSCCFIRGGVRLWLILSLRAEEHDQITTRTQVQPVVPCVGSVVNAGDRDELCYSLATWELPRAFARQVLMNSPLAAVYDERSLANVTASSRLSATYALPAPAWERR